MKGLLITYLIAMVLSGSSAVIAAPWTSIDDVRLRQSLQLLVDSGYISLNVTAWPVNWASIQRELSRISRNHIFSPSARVAYDYISYELSRDRSRAVKVEAGARASSEAPLLKKYGDAYGENNELWGKLDAIGNSWALGIKASMVEGDYSDSPIGRLDGSYIAGLWGNWIIGIGAVDRWWGAGWQSSLVLSTNARPVPGIYIKRNNDSTPDSNWLKWVGPWSLDLFLGQLERDRYISDAKFLGARFSFRPVQPLEVGITRVAQWGGEGRPETLSSLYNLMIGKDNRDDGGVTEENEPGNQLGGIDVRYSFRVNGLPSAGYIQAIGEDEAGGLPSKTAGLVGLESNFRLNSSSINTYVEYVDTRAGRLFTGKDYVNTFYSHSIYQNGYRYKGRTLGASIDNDSKMVTLGVSLIQQDDSLLTFSTSYIELNDDASSSGALPHVSFNQKKLMAYRLEYQDEWNALRYRVGMNVYSEEMANDYTNSGHFALSAEGTYRF
ncbi:hypothetical protein BTA51_07655 [Hahella sp. CCB-MM4]|uniref:capsule assembly Wzi family protein n=1 Tax=Hahella sp. (strain CCB-MM4) TaxID=1926491 RepID=UPI000BD10C58|nr:capsule assembly Wzi family protein [Hahella sp. CCB-MM4]OZG73681.1 hypothetical protein BTA51_07655 [Hahella sp. CCB-MM4]